MGKDDEIEDFNPEGVESATTYEAAVAAFTGEVPGDEENETAVAVAPAAAAQTPAPDGTPAVVVPPAAPAAVAPEIQALLDTALPAHDSVPEMWRGQTLAKVLDAIREKDRYIGQRNTEFSQLRDRFIAAEAVSKALMAEKGGAPAAPTKPGEPAAPTSFDLMRKHGIENPLQEFLKDPETFFGKFFLAAAAEGEARVAGRVEPLEKNHREGEVAATRTQIRAAADAGRDAIARQMGIADNPVMLQKFRDRFEFVGPNISRAAVAGDAFKPESWIAAYRAYETAVGGFGPLIDPATLPAPTARNPPVATRTHVTRHPESKAVARTSRIAREMLEEAGLDSEKYGTMIEQEIAEGRATGRVGGEK